MKNALHLAAIGGHLEIVKYLMPKLGDSRFDLDSTGESCLHRAVTEGHSEMVRYLIEEGGFDPCCKGLVSDCSQTPQMLTLMARYLPISYSLQDDLDCFLRACSLGQLQVVRELVNRQKMNPHVVNEVCVSMCACVHVYTHMCFCVCMCMYCICVVL